MPRSVTAVYRSRPEAEAVAMRLRSIGVDETRIQIAAEDEPEEPGMFDRLAKLLVADAAAAGVRLTAEIEPDQLDQAAAIVEQGGDTPPNEITEQSFLFRETAEKLVIEKEVAVREELIMQRRARERVETIHDTVRRTEVEVERFGPDGP